ncbi:TPM domain-containing protein [Candidatus Woesearchaeota archaeon]|nr:TPM domain-containing protein [Candidatus Woesearchaeota archaeon]
MDKQGLWALTVFGKYILALASLIAIVAFMYTLFADIEDQSVEQACRTSIITRGEFKFGVFNKKETASLLKFDNIYPVQCKTQSVIVPVDEPPRTAHASEVQELIMDDVADLMAKCWWMFAQGQYHDILDDPGKDDQLCHVCYSFTIDPDLDDYEPIDVEEDFLPFLSTHPYRPGLLQGGNALIGGIDDYEYQPQDVFESTRKTRRLNEERLLNSRAVLRGGVADFSGLFTEDQPSLEKLQQHLSSLAGDGLTVVYVIVPSLPERTFEDDTDLGFRIIDEWQLGIDDRENAAVFLFSLNNGILHYATQFGADAVLPDYILQGLFEPTVGPYMAVKKPKTAILEFSQSLSDLVSEYGEENVKQTLLFQRSYVAYITGGKQGATSPVAPKDTAKGAIKYDKDDVETIEQGKAYAISYVSTKWRGCTFLVSFCKSSNPNAIGLSTHDSLFSQGAICNMYTEDG